MKWRDFEIPESIQQKVFYEVYPLKNIKDKVIAIIGAGDAAFDYALQVAAYNKVMIYNRTDKTRCLPLLQLRAKENPRISYLDNTVLNQITEDQTSTCLQLFFQTNDGMESRLADYVIFATGRRPELSFADPFIHKHLDELQEDGKLFLIGDVKNDLYRQASIAAGDGIRAAMEIFINESNKKNRG